MAGPESETTALARQTYERTLSLTTIPNLIIIFVLVIGALHILASIIEGADVTDFGALRTPFILLMYALVILIVMTIVQANEAYSLPVLLSNFWTMMGLLALFVFLVVLSSQGSEWLPEIFTIVAVP